MGKDYTSDIKIPRQTFFNRKSIEERASKALDGYRPNTKAMDSDFGTTLEDQMDILKEDLELPDFQKRIWNKGEHTVLQSLFDENNNYIYTDKFSYTNKAIEFPDEIIPESYEDLIREALFDEEGNALDIGWEYTRKFDYNQVSIDKALDYGADGKIDYLEKTINNFKTTYSIDYETGIVTKTSENSDYPRTNTTYIYDMDFDPYQLWAYDRMYPQRTPEICDFASALRHTDYGEEYGTNSVSYYKDPIYRDGLLALDLASALNYDDNPKATKAIQSYLTIKGKDKNVSADDFFKEIEKNGVIKTTTFTNPLQAKTAEIDLGDIVSIGNVCGRKYDKLGVIVGIEKDYKGSITYAVAQEAKNMNDKGNGAFGFSIQSYRMDDVQYRYDNITRVADCDVE